METVEAGRGGSGGAGDSAQQKPHQHINAGDNAEILMEDLRPGQNARRAAASGKPKCGEQLRLLPGLLYTFPDKDSTTHRPKFYLFADIT